MVANVAAVLRRPAGLGFLREVDGGWRTAGQVFAGESDGVGHLLLGHHDGPASWVVNVAADPSGVQQFLVSRHEAADHRLHSSTP